MFAKLSTLAFVLPLVSALTINPLTGATTGGEVTISWTASTTDAAYFSIVLVNTAFHDTFAIANNVQTSLGSISIELPQVPVTDGYTLEAIAINNINDVYSESGSFSIGSASSSTSTAASTSSTPATTATGTITTGTLSTPSATTTKPVSSGSSASVSGSSTSASATPSSFSSSGAASFKLAAVAPAAALVLSAVAGAVMVF